MLTQRNNAKHTRLWSFGKLNMWSYFCHDDGLLFYGCVVGRCSDTMTFSFILSPPLLELENILIPLHSVSYG